MVATQEAMIREKFIKIFKKYVGKGPKNTEVKIFKKLLVVIFQDILTPLEKNLIQISCNEEEVYKLRETIADPAIVEYKEFLVDLTDEKIVDMLAKNNFAMNERYYLFVFENNIEEKLKRKLVLT